MTCIRKLICKDLDMERRSVIFYLAAAAMALIIIVLSVFVILKVTYDGCEDFEKICLSPECIQVAAQILNYLDNTVNPCTNFYAFACGNFLSSAEIADHKSYVSTSSDMYDELQKQLKEVLEEPSNSEEINYIKILKSYYQACNNVVAIEQLGLDIVKQILEDAGGWPVLDGPYWKGYDFEWYDYVYKLKEVGLDTDFIVTLSITHDKENTSNRIITVDLPSLNIPSNGHILSMSTEFNKIYYPYMISVAKKMGANESRAVEELNQSLEFEINLKHSSALDETPLVLTVSEFNDKFPSIPWFEYIRTLMLPYAVITKREKILVAAPAYIKSLDSLLTKTPKRVQANYIMWRAIEAIIPYLSEELRDRAFAYESAIYDISEKPPRWQYCIHETYNRLPLPLSSLYVQNYFDGRSKERATTLVNLIKEQFLEVLKKSERMHKDVKERITAKISGMIEFVAYPNKLLQMEWVEEMYDKLKVNPDEYLQSYLNINIRNRELFIKSLRQPATDESWFNHRIITEMHTSYNPMENSLSVSAGSLQGLLFNRNHPDYLNFGGIGFAIAREIAEAFDWSEAKINNSENLQCFVDQYSSFIVPTLEKQVNGTATLSENIVDNVGIRIAYLAYQKWLENNGPQQNLAALKYTPNQLFWVSFAINQCSKEKPDFISSLVDEYGSLPVELRVIGSLSNLKEFANDFECAPVTPMNPSNKCNIL